MILIGVKLIKGFLFLLLFSISFNNEVVDGLLAVVGDHVILKSEVVQQVQIEAAQRGLDVSTSPLTFEKMYQSTLESMVDQYIVLTFAETDTNIVVTDDEIEQTLNQQIDDFIYRAGSVEALENMMGKNLKDIRREYWFEIRNMLMINQFKYLITANTDITRQEVLSFYDTYKDSLPITPTTYDFSVIDYVVGVGEKTKGLVLDFMTSLKDSLKYGVSFESIAQNHSEDPGSALDGGDLGYTDRGTLVPEYEKVAYTLSVGGVSDPFISPFGVHLLKLVDRVGEKVHTKHVLKTLTPSQGDFDLAVGRVKEIYQNSSFDPFVFDSVATTFSFEDNTNSGVFIGVAEENIPDYIVGALRLLNENSCSAPFEVDSKLISLVYLHKKNVGGEITPFGSWGDLEALAKNHKLNSFFSDWINKKRGSVYIKYY